MKITDEVTLVLTVPELDYVINALSACPYKEVNGFIAKIVNQVNSQESRELPLPAAPGGSDGQPGPV